MRIDVHTHIISDKLPDLAAKYGGDRWPTVQKTCCCGGQILVGGKVFREITDQSWDPVRRIADMDEERVDMQVISPVPVTLSYFASPEAGLELCKFQNDFIARTVAHHSSRFVGLGAVPLQSTDMAIQEMDRIIHQLKLNGIEIGTNVNGMNLDEPSLLPFFETAAQWDVPIFIHPWEGLGRERMPRHNFMYSVGMPSETALAAASLTWGGVMEKFPTLKICMAHGGGAFPYILPRLDQAWNLMKQAQVTAHQPSYYAKLFYYDSLVYDPGNLRYIIDRFGVDKVVIGTDYPFLIRETPAAKVLDDMEHLTPEHRWMIEGENVSKFLNLKRSKEHTGVLKKTDRI